MRVTRVLAVLLGVIVIAAVLLFSARSRRASASEFFTAPVDNGPLRNVINATGVVQTVVTVQVGSQVSGQVLELYADFNSVVKRGQLLARLDPRNFEAQMQNSVANVAAVRARVRSAEAEIKTHAATLQSQKANVEATRVARDNASTLFKRAADISARGLGSRNDFDNAKANADSAQARYDQAVASVAQVEAQSASIDAQVEQTKAQLAQAQADLDRTKLNLEYCDIYSPVDGVVISRNIDVGQTIAASMQAPTLFSIANNLTQMQVNANVDEADIGSVGAAQDVKFTVDAYPGDVFSARISEIRLSPQTVQNVVTYSVILAIDNADMKLRPGMTANITLIVDQREKVLKVPNAALRYTPSDPGAAPAPAAPTRVPKAEGTTDTAGRNDDVVVQLAPGQKWNPADKIKFHTTRRVRERPGIVWVLASQRKPDARRLVLGITDGSASELLWGDLKAGDLVIIGDSKSGAAAAPPPTQRGGFGIGIGAGGGGRRGF